jgi:hypothetical protein
MVEICRLRTALIVLILAGALAVAAAPAARALLAPAGSGAKVDIKPGFDLAALFNGERLAMADPDSVPGGKYSEAALENSGSGRGWRPCRGCGKCARRPPKLSMRPTLLLTRKSRWCASSTAQSRIAHLSDLHCDAPDVEDTE